MGRRVAVVGGGVAGLHAARLLARRGADVVLLERRSVLGGKIRTTRGDGCWHEAGPWRFYDSHETLHSVFAELGVATRPIVDAEDNPDMPTVIRGKVVRLGDLCAGTLVDAGILHADVLRRSGVPRGASFSDVLRLALGSAAVPAECGTMTVVDFLTRPAPPARAAVGQVAVEVLKHRFGDIERFRTEVTVERMSRYADRGRRFPRPMREATDGLDRFVAALGDRATARGVAEVRRLCLVEEVRRRAEGGWVLRCRAAGGACEVGADAVVLACHALQKLRFDPPLDAPLAAAVAAFRPANALKALLRFRRRFWEEAPYNISGGIARLDSEVNEVYYPNPQPGPEGYLMVYVLNSEKTLNWSRLTHAQRVDMYLGAVQSLHPATDVRALLADVEENFWFGPWAAWDAGAPDWEPGFVAAAAAGDRGGVFVTGPPRAWMDEAMKEGAAAAERAAAFLRLPPAAEGSPEPAGGGGGRSKL